MKLANPFPNKPWFLRVYSVSLLKTPWENGQLFVTSNFSFCNSVFYPFREFCAIFIKFKIVVCKLGVWKSQNRVVWEMVLNLKKMIECYLKGLKALWEKEKLVVTHNFSFSHRVFKRLELQTNKNKSLFG